MSRLNPNAGAFVPSFSVPVVAVPAATAVSAPAATAVTLVAAISPAKAAKPTPIVTAPEVASAAKAATPSASTKATPSAKAAASTPVESTVVTDEDVEMETTASDRIVYSIDYLLQFQPICDTVPCYFPDVVRAPAPQRLGRYINDRLVYTVPELLHFQPLYQMFPPDLEWSETLAIVSDSVEQKAKTPSKPSKKERAKAKAAAAAAATSTADQLQYDPTLMCYFNPTEYAAALSMAPYGSSSTPSAGDKSSANGNAEIMNPVDEAAVAKRQLAALLDDVQPESIASVLAAFEKIEITCTHTLQEVISQLFDRAIAEPALWDAYAQLYSGMAERTPEFKEGAKTINFRRILLTRCYEALIEEPETTPLNVAPSDSDPIAPQHSWRRQCMLQNVCFIGELFRRQLLTENIMHVCVAMMLEDEVHPQMDVIEAACRLLMLVGDLLDGSSPASRRTMDEYFDVLQRLADPSAAPLSLQDTIAEMTSVRAGGWAKKRVEGAGSPAKGSSTPLASSVAAALAGASPVATTTGGDASSQSVSTASSS